MKKFNLFKNNTSWISYLIPSFTVSFILLIFSLLIVILNGTFTSEFLKAKQLNNYDNSPIFKYETIVFPISFILSIYEIIVSIYLLFNFVNWINAFKNSMQKRKKINLLFLFISIPSVIFLTIDSIIRFFYVVGNFNTYLTYANGREGIGLINYSQYGILGTFKSYGSLYFGNFGFNGFILLILSFILSLLFYVFYFFQKFKFKSEFDENSKEDVQNFYRKLEKSKIEKHANKNKQNDLTKEIKNF